MIYNDISSIWDFRIFCYMPWKYVSVYGILLFLSSTCLLVILWIILFLFHAQRLTTTAMHMSFLSYTQSQGFVCIVFCIWSHMYVCLTRMTCFAVDGWNRKSTGHVRMREWNWSGWRTLFMYLYIGHGKVLCWWQICLQEILLSSWLCGVNGSSDLDTV